MSSPAAPGAGSRSLIEPWVRQVLRCPVTGSELVDGTGPQGEPELVSTSEVNRLAYPIRDGIPLLLESQARRLDRSA